MPNIQALTALIRVQDSNNTAVSDVSNSTFAMAAPLILTSPVGGEVWEGGTNQTITWVASGTSNYYSLEYSTNGGISWSYIDDYFYNSSGTFNWSVPNEPSTQTLVRIADVNNACKVDQSELAFEIAPATPTITLYEPEEGSVIYSGTNAAISWGSAYVTSNQVAIEYSTDGGTSWSYISTLTENDGYWNWPVPSEYTSNAFVRITDLANPSTFDQIGPFTIAEPFINITSPTAASSLTQCEDVQISWTHGGTQNYRFGLRYSTDGGTSWTSIYNNLYQPYPTGSNYTWNYPLPEGEVILRVFDYNNPTLEAFSEVLNFNGNNDIIVTHPNGGEILEVGNVVSLNWASAPDISYVGLEYSTDGGATYSTIDGSEYSDGNYNWTVPNTVTEQARFRVYNTSNNYCENDESDADFAIRLPEPSVLSPNGGETYYFQQNATISWTSVNFDDTFVKLEFSPDNGTTWQTISAAENNDGSRNWTIPEQATTEGLIRVNSLSDPSLTDVSDAVFSIAPAIVVTSPNGDNGIQDWRVCTETTITWTSGGTSNYFRLYYSLDNGNSWSTINSNYYSPGFQNAYDWVMPGTPSPVALIRIEDRYNASQVDYSDDAFTIAPAITVTSPNGGETFAPGQTVNITWENNGATNYVNIDYSSNGGSTWSSIVVNYFAPFQSYAWTVPAAETSNYLIRVTDNVDNCKMDQSDAAFAVDGIVPGSIALLSPLGGELWESCTSQLISWDEVNTSGSFDLAYSPDLGTTWVTLVEDYVSAEGTFNWYVPNLTSSEVLIRVSDHNNANTQDETNLPLTLEGVVADAGPDVDACPGDLIFLQATGGVSYSWSPTTSLTNPETANPLAGVNETITYTVTVTDENGCTASDSMTITASAGLCEIEGCLDPDAYNFNPNATIDNGLCLYTTGGNACPNDLNGDGEVGAVDLLLILGSFGALCP